MKSFQELVEEKYGIDRDEQIAKRLSSIPVMYRSTYKKAVTHKSMRAAVNSQCLECVGYERKEISVCTDLGCPLYSFRPYQKLRKTVSLPPDFLPEAILAGDNALQSTNS